MINSIRRGINTVSSYLFPVFCLGCDEEGHWLCEQCTHRLDVDGVFDCPACHAPGTGGFYCRDCPICAVDQLIAATRYLDTALSGKILYALKYQFAEDVQQALYTLLADSSSIQVIQSIDPDSIVPVPLHHRRYAERGFNQAVILAEILGGLMDCPIEEYLERYQPTKQQARLTKEDRIRNVDSVFRIKKNKGVEGKTIILVDDVYTTGATANACARVLKCAGAERVVGWTFARGA